MKGENTGCPAAKGKHEIKKVAALVSGGGTNLQALIDNAPDNPRGQLALVLSSRPGVYALTRARQAGIPAEVLFWKDFPSREAYTDAVLDVLRAYDIDIVVLCGFLRALSPRFSEVYANRAINVHPALLPDFGGMGFYGLKVHEAVLASGVKTTGATVHFVTGTVDGGPILLQKRVEVMPDDTPESLQRRVMEQAEWVILPQALKQLCESI